MERKAELEHETYTFKIETDLQEMLGREGAAVLVQAGYEKSPPINVKDLFGEAGSQLFAHRSGLQNASLDEAANVASDAWAISQGGHLEFDDNLQSVADLLLNAASKEGQGIVFMEKPGSELFITYAEILNRAQRILTGLQQAGLTLGEHVLFQCKSNYNLISGFWACLLGGFIPAPIGAAPSYAENNAALKKLLNSWTLLGRPAIIADEALVPDLLALEQTMDMTEIRVYSAESLEKHEAAVDFPAKGRESFAMSLLTSGSTGIPKCVQHRNHSLLALVQSVTAHFELTSREVWLNWMPLDHVGGIVFSHLTSVFLGCKQVIASTEVFLARPLQWLDLIDKHRVSMSWAPNFAFALIAAEAEQIKQKYWDLSSMRYIINAAESIVPKTAHAFLQMLIPFGLKPDAISPAFGMSETSSGVTFAKSFCLEHDRLTGVYHIDKLSLSTTLKEIDEQHINSVSFVELGKPVPGMSIRIVDQDNQLKREGQIGRLQVKGEALMAGYYKNPSANSESFVGDGWFNTGDLGFLREGALTLTGREKDIIILNGKNHFNYEIEAIIEEVFGVETTYSAAAAITAPGAHEDQLALFFSPYMQEPSFYLQVADDIKYHVVKHIGIEPTYLIPVSKEAFPKTNSGKIQHGELVRRFNAGEFDEELKLVNTHLERDTLPSWFFQQAWKEQALTEAPEKESAGGLLIFSDLLGLGNAIAAALPDEQVYHVYPGQAYRKIDASTFEIHPERIEDYRTLWNELAETGSDIRQLLHLWNYTPYLLLENAGQLRLAQSTGSLGLISLYKALEESRLPADLLVITTYSCNNRNTTIASEKATIESIVKAAGKEMPGIRTGQIDFNEINISLHCRLVLNELRAGVGRELVSYVHQTRYIPALERVDVQALIQDEVPPFVEQGLYLITGGLGAVGEQLAQHLLEHYNASIVLAGRTLLPPQEHWDLELGSGSGQSDHLRRYLGLQKLAEAGGEVAYHSVDLTCYEEMKALIEASERKHQKRLSGIIHLAGIGTQAALKDCGHEQIEMLYNAKVYGTFVLYQLLLERPEAIFVTTSSTETIDPGMLMGPYSASNRFVEAFSEHIRNTSSIRCHCLAWGMWDNLGMSKGNVAVSSMLIEQGLHPISPQQGVLSFVIGSTLNLPVLYIGLNERKDRIARQMLEPARPEYTVYVYFPPTGDSKLAVQELKGRIDAYMSQFYPEAPYMIKYRIRNELLTTIDGQIDRRALLDLEMSMGVSDYVAPRNETEEKLARIWSGILGKERVGIQDNFFAMGGNSLKLLQMTSAIQEQFDVTITIHHLFQNATIARLAGIIIQEQPDQGTWITPAGKPGTSSLSQGQRQQWYLYRREPENPYYNTAFTLEFQGDLNQTALMQGLQHILNRHQVLRSYFMEQDGLVSVCQDPGARLDFSIQDLSGMSVEAQKPMLEAMLQEQVNRPFQLEQAPLHRFVLIKCSADSHILLVVMHHIVFDGWSVGLFLEELKSLYAHYSEQTPLELPELAVQYADYAAWEENRILQPAYIEQLEYWQQRYADAIPSLDFPTDYKRPRVLSHYGKTAVCEIDSKITARLMDISRAEDCTLYMTLLAAFVALLNRYTQQEEIIIGTISANRNSRQVKHLIGYFVNTLPLSFQVSGNSTFKDCLKQVKSEVLETLAHGEAAFEHIVEMLPVQHDPSRHPLFQILFALHDHYFEHTTLGKLHMKVGLQPTDTAKFDFALHAYPSADKVLLNLEYNTELFREDRMNALLKHYVQLLEGISLHTHQRISQISILADEEQHYLRSINDFHAVPYPQDNHIVDLFEQQASATPEQTAVCFGQESLTYAELNQCANQLARRLRSIGVEREQLVGIIVERSMEMVVAILAVLKAGGAYVPIDPDFPEDRIQYMLQDCRARVLLTQTHLPLPADYEGQALYVDRDELYTGDGSNLPSINSPADLAYVIYTSGTTGKPKGVLMEHRNVVRLFFNDQPLFDFQAADVWTLFHSYTFDFSVWEMYGALLHGGKLVIVPKETAQDPQQFLSLVNKFQVTVLNQTPTAFYGLINEILQQNTASLPIRYVIFGGEALAPIMLKEIAASFPSIEYINMYGITETAVHVTFKRITAKEIDSNISDIGQPIPTLKAYVMDAHLNLMPVGTVGELFIGGEGLARGYLNLPELTAAKFIPSPFMAGERLYRSGDLVKMLPGGSLEYQGRSDQQVKIRGYRIELGDIESQLLKHSGVREAVVAARLNGSGEHELIAYIVPCHKLTTSELRAYLSQLLPGYMIPAYFIQMEHIPLTANGKVDRKQLPGPDEQMESGIIYEAPANEGESKLMDIWQEKLQGLHFGVHDDFFVLGGDSIKAIRILSSINECFDSQLTIKDLYQYPTIRNLYTYMQSGHLVQAEQPILLNEQILARWETLKRTVCEAMGGGNIEEVYPMSGVQLGMVYHSMKNPDAAMYHDQFGYDLSVDSFDIQRFEAALRSVVAVHPVLRTSLEVDRFTEPVQIVWKEIPVKFEAVNLEPYSPSEQAQIIHSFFEQDRKLPFLVKEAPLWRAKVFLLNRHQAKVCVSCHHAILDGWSLAAFMTGWIQAYIRQDEAAVVSPGLKASPKDFMLEQERLKNDESYKVFWRNELEDYRRFEVSSSADQAQQYSFVTHTLDQEMLNQLNHKVARKHHTNLKAVLFSAYIAALNMFSYDNDLLVGLVEHSRPECADADRMLGCFLNTVPFRIVMREDWTWADLLQAVQDKQIQLKAYGRLSLLEIYRSLGESAQGENPLFDTMFNFVDFHVYDELKDAGMGSGDFKLDMEMLHDRNNTLLDFTVSATGDHCLIRVGSVWEPEQSKRLIQYFEAVVSRFIHHAEERIDKAALLSPAEYDYTIHALNDTDTVYEGDASLMQRFERRAAETPDRAALLFGDEQLTYGELDRKTNQLAHILRARGVQSNSIVGLAAERSFEMLIGIIAVMKAGGAYMPIDPHYPAERVRYLLEHSGSELILTQQKWMSAYEQLSADMIALDDEDIYLEENSHSLNPVYSSDDLAYVIYTSGSTGRPKGVMIKHGSLLNLLYALEEEYPLEKDDTYLLKTTFTFDVSVTELFGWIVGEGKLVILPPELEKDITSLAATIRERRITHLNFVPSMLQLLLQYEQLASQLQDVKYVFVAGEAFPVDLARRFQRILPAVRLENIYGPTEVTVYATKYSIAPGPIAAVPIGKPLSNIKVFVLSKLGQLQPPGIPGELCVAGSGVASGYLNNAELTSRSFVTSSIPGIGTMYRTGDLAVWSKDGTLHYLGRIDTQVKVRGYRIETGEIEAHLAEYENIGQVAVVLKREAEEGQRVFLCAYYVAPQPLDAHLMRQHLSQALPHYMIPSYFIWLPEMPLTHSGKADRKALEQLPIVYETLSNQDDSLVSLSWEQEQLIKAWKSVFKTDRIQVNDSFYALGGDSIMAIQLSAKLSERGLNISVGDILKHQTIADICQNVDWHSKARQYEQGIVRGEKLPTPIDYWFIELGWSHPGHYVQAVQMDLNAVPDIERMEDALNLLIQHHDALRLNCRLDSKSFYYNEAHLGERLQIGVVDLSQWEDKQAGLDEVSRELQGEFDLASELLLRAALVQIDFHTWKLMLCAHHLIVDGVSWRILLDDLFHIYRSLEQNEQPILPPKTASLQEYGEWLHAYAAQTDFAEDIAYWNQVHNTDYSIPTDMETKDWRFKHFRAVEGSLNLKQTAALKRIASRSISNVSVQDVLLMSLVKCLQAWTGTTEVVIDMESHGRHSDELNYSRTVGWFTAMYPIRMTLQEDMDPSQQLSDLSQQLKSVPNHGFHYGILNYLTKLLPARDRLLKDVQFNYLGEFTPLAPHDLFSGFQLTANAAPENHFLVKLDVTCWITDDLLNVAFRYNSNCHREETIRSLHERYLNHIQVLVESLAEDASHLQADSLDAADLSSEELEALFDL